MLNTEFWMRFPSHLEPPALRSLSLAFILEELVQRFEQVAQLINTQEKSPEKCSKELIDLFSLDCSSPKQGMFPDKLCYYCTILVQASNKTEDDFLQKELTEMRISILQFRVEQKASFLRLFYEQLRSFFSSLIPFLFQARTDENLLIRFIEYKELLNKHIGPNTIEEMIQSFYPSGTAYLRTIISEGLTRRGFASFLAEKEHLVDTIEWESPCLPTRD